MKYDERHIPKSKATKWIRQWRLKGIKVFLVFQYEYGGILIMKKSCPRLLWYSVIAEACSD